MNNYTHKKVANISECLKINDKGTIIGNNVKKLCNIYRKDRLEIFLKIEEIYVFNFAFLSFTDFDHVNF